MKIQRIVLLLAFLLATTAYTEDRITGETGALILEELKGMRASLDRMAEELSELRLAEKARKSAQCLSVGQAAFIARGPDIANLADLTLSDNPNPDEVKMYILDIVNASPGQNAFSSRDPQVELLTQIGQKNLPLLIEVLSYVVGLKNDFYIKQAIVNLADENSKSMILGVLPIHQDLIEVVIRHGWEEDAKDILLTELKNTEQDLPSGWIQAVASLNDPESYPLLRDYFINGPNSSSTYKSIKHLPIKDMDEAVNAVCKKTSVRGVGRPHAQPLRSTSKQQK